MIFTSAFSRPFDWLDSALDKLTTYRLVLYLLVGYLLIALGLSATHKLSYTPDAIIISTVWLLVVCRFCNWVLGWWFKVPRNQESDIITALILSLIFTPTSAGDGLLIYGATAGVAMVSKYILSVRGKHIFNPAAIGALAAGAVLHNWASWWVGTKSLLPFVIVGAILIARKMKRGWMILAFLATFVAYTFIRTHSGIGHSLSSGFSETAIIFFASVMLTEPLTSPTTTGSSLIYALVVGIFYSITKLRLAPEEALLVGNGLAYLLLPNRSLILHFKGVRQEAAGIYSYLFDRPRTFSFAPGQYMEWTLGGVKIDGRGNRRYLTIASSPTEAELMFTIRRPADKMSRFKSKLDSLKLGQQILAAQLAGSFNLPANPKTKLAFLAGGVGITPYRSMVKFLIDGKQTRDIHLFYGANSPAEFAFSSLFRDAGPLGLKTHYVVAKPSPNWKGSVGYINGQLIQKVLPDYGERTFYISGPQGFVSSAKQDLLKIGVPKRRIITDFFPGYN